MRKGASAEGRGGPLKIRCRGSSRSTLPCFLVLRKADFRRGNLFPAKRYSLAVPYVNYAPEFAIDPMDPRDQHAIIGVGYCGRCVCSNSVELINLSYSANPLLSNPAAARVIRGSRIKDICPR